MQCISNGDIYVTGEDKLLKRYEYPNEKELANEGLVNGDPVHFNQQLDILGTIKDLGYYPIFYYGSFEIDNHDFELCFEELKNHKIVFKPKKECAYRGL